LENVSQIFTTRFHAELKVQYIDEDNDRITVSTELEWNEALRFLEPFPVKKLFLSEGNGVFFKDSPPPVPLFFYEESSKPASESSNCNSASKKEAPKKASCPRFGRAGPHFVRKFGGGGGCAAKHQRHQTHLDALKEAVPRCLGTFFPEGKILPHHLPEFLKEAVKVKLIGNSENDVDLDVNIPLLRQILFRRGLTMLDSHKYEEGRQAFSALVELSARDPLAHYNLACAEALLGNHEAAVTVLSRSVECGYRNLAHLLADPDLDSLRTNAGYLKVVEDLRALHSVAVAQNDNNEKKEEVEEVKEKKSEEMAPLTALRMVEKKVEQPEQEQEKKEEPKKEIAEVVVEKKEEVKIESAPQKQVSEEEAKYETELQLLADMGFVDRQKNLVLLVAMKGDLPNVIHHLF
jgi:hypothetical protein